MRQMIKLLTIFLLSVAFFTSFFVGSLHAQGLPITFTKLPACRTTEWLYGNVSGIVYANHNVSRVTYENYKVAVYIYVNGWWNKPTWASPLTPIASDGTWATNVATGGNDTIATKYAAFLVPNGYNPPLLGGDQTLPPELYTHSLANVQKDRQCPLREIQFSGYTWQVKYSWAAVGPGPNYFSDDPNDVFVDSQGRLHLKIVKRNNVWYATEVINKSILGYGTYKFHVVGSVNFDPSVVLGLFTWDDTSSDYYHREIDIELSRWGSTSLYPNAQFVVQPYWETENIHKFNFILSGGGSTHSFNWNTSRIIFQSEPDYMTMLFPSNSATKWTYTGDNIPASGKENARMNLWLFNGVPPTNGQPVEVIIDRFTFTPNP